MKPNRQSPIANRQSPGAKRKSAGRPAKITAAVVERVAETMSYGVPEEYACELHGVNAATFGPAVSRNEAFKAIKKRWDARFIERACKGIAQGGEVEKFVNAEGEERDVRKPWQGLAWLLERRYKPHFNRTDQHALTAPGGEPVLSEEAMADLSRIARELFVKGEA